MKNFRAERERGMKWGLNVILNGVLQVDLAEKVTSEQIQTGEFELQLSGEENLGRGNTECQWP